MSELTTKRAEEMLAQLTEFYGERVTTASNHCSALLEWMRVMTESGYAPEVAKTWGLMQINLLKSNLAARLVYGGEQVRTEQCPIHLGHWSGCVWGDGMCTEGCMYGSNVTGWLKPRHSFEPFPNDEEAARTREHFNWDSTTRCKHCGGTAAGLVHQAVAA